MIDSVAEASWQVKSHDPEALTRLLGLPEWVVTGMEYDDRLDCLMIQCEPAWDWAVCPRCGRPSPHPHQYQRRTVRDLPMAGHGCYLEFAARRFNCEPCRRAFTESLEWVAPHGRCTRRYEAYLFEQCRGASLQDVARRERLGYKTVEAIYYRWAEHHVQARQEGLVRRLGIDEIALKKGHDHYALVVSDLERAQVLTVLPERTKEALEAYFDTWSPEQRAAVEDVAIDLWLPYRLTVEAKLPNARLNGDRFHVMKNLNDHVTSARREIQRSASEADKEQLKGYRWILVKNQDTLSEQEKAKLDEMYTASPTLKRLHELKESLRAVFETAADRATAAEQLQDWIAQVEKTGLKSLAKFVTTLRNWWDPILNYFNDHITSGFVEGMNNKIKLIKRRAYGYRNFVHFRLRLLIECGGAT